MDAKTLLKSLNEHNVHFIIIGGVALTAHGRERFTKDIDIFVEPTLENMARTFAALQTCGYDLQDTTIEEALQKKLLLRGYILLTDIHPSVKGVDFETVWKNKIRIPFQGEEVYFASLDDMMAMKRAAGRPQDLADLEVLEEIKRQLALKKK